MIENQEALRGASEPPPLPAAEPAKDAAIGPDAAAPIHVAQAGAARTFELDAVEARVLGTLIEKALSTPEQYPLSLHALLAGCNQKSNRDPVTLLEEHDVLRALAKLRDKQLAGTVRLSGSRVDRFRQNVRETVGLESYSMAIIAELLLRGPQTTGELRGHVSRMAPVHTIEEMQKLMDPLVARGYVKLVPPAPGSRAPRYVQLCCEGLHAIDSGPVSLDAQARPDAAPARATPSRLDALEAEVRKLTRVVELLATRLGQRPEDLYAAAGSS